MPYIDPAIIEQVKKIDLLTYLETYEPSELVKLTPNTYATKTHDSLKISNGKWYWWSRGFGGKSALDYLIKVRDMTFMDAVRLLDGHKIALEPARSQERLAEQKRQAFRLPDRALTNDNAINYLRTRGIDPYVIRECVKAGLIYETAKHMLANVAFVGLDEKGKARYAALRGCRGDFKGESPGSDKRYSFKLISRVKSPELHIFEGAIDVLSYATLMLNEDRDWRTMNLLSLGGIPPKSNDSTKKSIPQAIVQYLTDNPHTSRVFLHLDNDEPGINAAGMIAATLYERCEVHIVPPEIGIDVNDELIAKRQTYEPESVELNERWVDKEAKKIRRERKKEYRDEETIPSGYSRDAEKDRDGGSKER